MRFGEVRRVGKVEAACVRGYGAGEGAAAEGESALCSPFAAGNGVFWALR